MIWTKTVFTASFLALVYVWAGYPLLLCLRCALVRTRPLRGRYFPTYSIIVAAHNEEAQIAAKLEDCQALRYARKDLEIIVASDATTVHTETIVLKFAARDPRIRLLRTEGRGGKSGAQNLAAGKATGEVLLFTDAGTSAKPDLLEQIAAAFSDAKVGMVAPVVYFRKSGSTISQAQGAYWHFERFLRQLESDIGILATASGAAFAIRRNLFRAIPLHYGDDCVVPLDVRCQGWTVVQDPQAIVFDEMPDTVSGELGARIRMTARNCSGTLSRPALLNPLRFPGTAWGLVSHKLLRWMTPFLLAGMFLANVMLAWHARFGLLFVLQCVFYVAALIGWQRSRQKS